MSACGRCRMATLRKPSGRTRSCRAWRFRIPGHPREARGSWSPARCCSEARGARPRCFARGTRRPVLSSRRFRCRGRPLDFPSRTQRQDGSTSPWRCALPTPWKSWLSHFRPRRHHPAAEDGDRSRGLATGVVRGRANRTCAKGRGKPVGRPRGRVTGSRSGQRFVSTTASGDVSRTGTPALAAGRCHIPTRPHRPQ